VCLSEHAREFVGPLTFRTLSGRPVLGNLFDPQSDEAVEHVALAERAHALVVAPATANLLGKAAAGIADDFLTTLLLAARCPVVMAPGMDGGMWEHPAVVANVATLRGRGVTVLEPDAGALASGLSARGRLPEADVIVEALLTALTARRGLAGQRVVVTAGPTREPIDPVRYISNRSSGRMGYALAAAAVRRGAQVTLVSGPTTLMPPAVAAFLPVQTAEDMREAVLHHASGAAIVIKAAAVADYRVRQAAAQKIKGKHDLTLDLVPNADILAEVAARGTGAFIVGFAAETNDVAANARAKLEGKYLQSPADALRAQEQALQGCRRCKLCEGRNTIVFGSGNPQAELVVIGEGPGADEDAQGLPFVGRAGQLLTRMLASVDLTRDEVYITNAVLCRPPGNRNPEADELAACAPFLADKLAVIQPKVILTLGSVATQALLRTKEAIGKLRGRDHPFGDAVRIPPFPPAFLLRNPG